MANLRLKKNILEVVDNQLKANNPPCTKDTYEKLVAAGYSKSEAKDKIGSVVLTEIFEEHKDSEGLRLWQEAQGIFESIILQFFKTVSLYDLMESQDYIYPIDGWLQDYEMELGNAGKYRERIAFCQKILELFDWKGEDDSCFQCGIGESLFREGKVGEAYEYYEN